ncbi:MULTISPECIES: UDP-N-acetylmuramate dehydrogenase [Glycomyces]|uniref:UDP-N-acetylenolpyruvoylglucosamine reductase n=2 Tax=Glycomyces TaxID=58113 RepID=A0A9X3PHK4_9ACTN|nr:UDP-N-acetylmuramate dehydrogenase [Glycomyces lechevalierae]MDA1384140.1 UDP-N-acetylmuramate dehydrogenase [Glycomyces lechevalierae]MDR7339430.1 UDP-N-acetylmuramate dehydrogenase [Glycomyces lechevalierae]
MTHASPTPSEQASNDPIPGKSLSEYTTLRIGGPARELVETRHWSEAVEAIRAAAGPTLVLGGGSNVVIGDAGFDGTVVLLRGGGIEQVGEGLVRVQAGHVWDEFAAWTVANGYSGVECLSGIPGSAGATPIQNVGAYGQEVAQTIAAVKVWDREADEIRDWTPAECGFAYRHSVFKHSDRYLVLSVDFRLASSEESQPIAYAELAKRLGVEVGDRAPMPLVREKVLELRRGKGMVLDETDHDTWSAGSFFTNPIIGAADFHEVAERAGGEPPHWKTADGNVKVSAAWLIGAAGFEKGHKRGNAGLSTKHTLALTNRGGASAAEILALAAEVVDKVEEDFGIRLHPEPVMVNASLG